MVPSLPPIDINAIPGMVVLSNAQGKILFANPSFLETTGFSAPEVEGAQLPSFWFPPHDSLADIFGQLETGRAWQKEIWHKRKDGSRFRESCAVSRISSGIPGEHHLLKVGNPVGCKTDVSHLKQTVKRLKESEESYHNIMRKAPIAISLTRVSDATYVEANDAWAGRTGYKEEEVLGRTSLELDIYRDLDVRNKIWEEFNSRGAVDDLELAFKNRNGDHLYSLVSARRIRFKGEDCLLYISTKIDALKATQKTLAEREENYRTILDMAPYPITISSRKDGRYLEVNKTFYRATGYTPEEVIGNSASGLDLYVHPLDRTLILDTLNKDGRIDNLEMSFRAKDGRITENIISMSTFRFRGEPCIIAIAVEITPLKQAQRALKESEARFRTIFETAADPIFVNDMETGRFLTVNNAACRHLGYGKSEFLAMSLDRIMPHRESDPVSLLSRIPRKNNGYFFESLHLRKDGSVAAVEVSSQQMTHQNRQVLLSIVRDVTRRKETEKELASYRKNLEKMVTERTRELEAAQKELVTKEKLAVLGQLTATVSHELRNPLGVIRSSNFFIQRKVNARNPKILKHFKRIDEQISLCDAIVDELLEYTRGRTPALVTSPMAPWMAQVVEQINEQQQMAIRLDLPPGLPPIPHDPEKMRRVLINLLNNAVQAVTAKAEEHVRRDTPFLPDIRVAAKKKERHLIIRVRDNGIGMDPGTRARAFEPLFTTKARGTGIGLAVVRKIVEDHGGTIDVESHADDGTCISVTLDCGNAAP